MDKQRKSKYSYLRTFESGHIYIQSKAADKFGNWVNTSEKLTIVVSPPFWQSWWFITLSILLIASLIYILFRYRTREIERSYKLQLVDFENDSTSKSDEPSFYL